MPRVALVFVGAGAGMAWEDYELAWGLLDVGGQEVNDGGDAHEALEPYAARGPDEATRAGLALAFSIIEGFVDATWSDARLLDHLAGGRPASPCRRLVDEPG